MVFIKNRRTGKAGRNPGLMPIDDITNEDGVFDMDPDSMIGRSPSQDGEEHRGTKRRRSPRKESSRKMS